MEIIIISTLGLLISTLFLTNAPMHDLKMAMYYEKVKEQNERN